MGEYINTGDRLMVHQKTRLDEIRDIIPKPTGYLPVKNLPTWAEMPLEQKLPVFPVPPGEIVISRGKIGETLVRPTTSFITTDPHHYERVPLNNYAPLHDSHMARYFRDDNILEALQKQGLVNEDNKVICSIQEFNRYRLYLATLYNDQVRQKLVEMENLKDAQRERDRALRREEVLEAGVGKMAIHNARSVVALKAKSQMLDTTRQTFLLKEKLAEQRKSRLEAERRRKQMAKIALNEEKRALQRERVIVMEEKDLEVRREILHKCTLKEFQSVAHREHLENQRKIQYEKKLSKWFEGKLLSAAQRLEREKEVQAEYSHHIKHRAIRRQKRVEKFREELPLRIEKSRAKKRRLEDIVRKFAMRWLNRVRARLNKPKDEKHESVFYSQTRHGLQEGMQYLQEKSGYEKLDDVVMNILKFKEALKRQLLLEEEEEEANEEEENYSFSGNE